MIDQKIFYIAVAVAILANVASRYFLRREQDPLRKALKLVRVNLVIIGGFCLLLWWQLPFTPVLSTFGYPQTEIDVQSAKTLLRYLQDYNRALVRTTEVLSRFIFVFVWWFIAMLFDLSKTISTTTR
jgi:hypothetical protein